MRRYKQSLDLARSNATRAAAFGVVLMLAGCSAIEEPSSTGRHDAWKQLACRPLVELKIKTYVNDQLRIDYSNVGIPGAIVSLGDGDPNYFLNVIAYAISNGKFLVNVKGGWEGELFSRYRFEQTLKTSDGQGVSTVLEVEENPVRVVVVPRAVADEACATPASGATAASARRQP